MSSRTLAHWPSRLSVQRPTNVPQEVWRIIFEGAQPPVNSFQQYVLLIKTGEPFPAGVVLPVGPLSVPGGVFRPEGAGGMCCGPADAGRLGSHRAGHVRICCLCSHPGVWADLCKLPASGGSPDITPFSGWRLQSREISLRKCLGASGWASWCPLVSLSAMTLWRVGTTLDTFPATFASIYSRDGEACFPHP